MPSIFLEQTKTLLRNRPKNLTLALIAEETELGEAWLETILYKKNFDPGVNKVETLYNYLANKPFSFEASDEVSEVKDENTALIAE